MPKKTVKKRDKGGRPPMPPDEKLSEIVGYRFTPSDAEEIRTATRYDEALIGRIRKAILREVRYPHPYQRCIAALSHLDNDEWNQVVEWMDSVSKFGSVLKLPHTDDK